MQCLFQLVLWTKTFSLTLIFVVKNKLKCGLSRSVLLPTTSASHYSFPKHFFVLFLHIQRVCKSFWKESLTCTSSLFAKCSRCTLKFESVFSVVKTTSVVKKEKEMWFSVVCTLINNDMRQHSGQNLLQTHLAALRESTTFWPLWWHVSLLITGHAKPHSIC